MWCEVPITFTQAALGADVVVPTLDGKVSYTVREGTQPGDVFGLKGKGIQRLGGRGRGDQYVRVTVEVPKNLNGKQKKSLSNSLTVQQATKTTQIAEISLKKSKRCSTSNTE